MTGPGAAIAVTALRKSYDGRAVLDGLERQAQRLARPARRHRRL